MKFFRVTFATVLLLSVGMSAAFWLMHVISPVSVQIPQPQRLQAVADDATTSQPMVARLLGGAGQSGGSAVPVRKVVLMGTIATTSDQEGVAQLVVDGQSVKTYRVGDVLAPGLTLNAVASRKVVLADNNTGKVMQVLELPKIPSDGKPLK